MAEKMEVPLTIMVHPEDKTILTLCFNEKSKGRVFGWISEQGNYIVVSEKDSEATTKRIIKNYFENILMEKGEFEAESTFKKILDEIEKGE